nr:translation initiation factor eif-2b subunit alpha [Quercus suber]
MSRVIKPRSFWTIDTKRTHQTTSLHPPKNPILSQHFPLPKPTPPSWPPPIPSTLSPIPKSPPTTRPEPPTPPSSPATGSPRPRPPLATIPTTPGAPNPAPRFSLGFRESFCVINEFNNWRKQPDLAEAVAAIRALAAVIRASEATTMMELEIELKKASDSLKSWDKTSISLTAGCDLFMRYVTRTSALGYEDFNSARSRLIERAEKFGEISCKARRIIAMLSQDFIFDGCTILVHGFSRVVLEVLKTAAQNKKLFRVFCTEGRPDRTGLRLSNDLAKLDVPVKLLIDSAVAYTMDEVDMVFVGADGVVESGGIINMMGTYQIALVAHSMNKPVYVAAESYKVIWTFAIAILTLLLDFLISFSLRFYQIL